VTFGGIDADNTGPTIQNARFGRPLPSKETVTAMRRDIPAVRMKDLPHDPRGLSSIDIAERRKRYGRNDILEIAGSPWLELARDTLKDPMIWFLVGTGLIYAVLGSYAEAMTLMAAILPLLGMDAFLHRRTQVSTEGLGRQLAQTARVVRDGALLEISASELVPGDRVRIETGEAFPADGLISVGEQLQADESSLTGEAYPVPKHALRAMPLRFDESAWIDDVHWGFAGTRLLTGQAEMTVVYTGGQTLYGEIVRAAAAGERERTPLQTAISNLVTLLIAAAGVLCLILAGVRLHQGHGWVDALVSAATLAVAALPEEFPVVFTLFLGVGVYRLARRKALVRRGVSVENIGRITCICSDKTGTITEGRLRLEHLAPGADVSEDELLRWAAFASRAESGDPMDTAILERVQKRAISAAADVVLETYPYTEQRRRETVVVRIGDRIHVASKGAPEVLLALVNLSEAERTDWASRVDRLAAEGHKVLACACWHLDGAWSGGEPDRGGRFLGLLAFEDPIRDGVIESVRECRAAGIRVVMVTGDHPATAGGVARQIGMKGGIVLGDELVRRLDDGASLRPDVDVVARALPTQKLALVRALKAEGEIVAVTGDGVNDVPALQAADIGIAMGERGTRSAREIASIVLLNDNFGTIVRAIAEGRQLFRNLQLSFQYLLLIHIPLVITATFIPLIGHPILYLPVHIVWLETLIHPTALLVFQELPARGPLRLVPKRREARFFSGGEWFLIATIGALITALILWTYDRSLLPGGSVEHARAMAMVALTCASAAATAVLSRLRTKTAWLMVVATVGSSLVLVQTPWLAARLSLQPLHRDDWLIAMFGGLLSVAGPMVLYYAARRLVRAAGNFLAGYFRRAAEDGRNEVTASRSPEAPLTRYAWLSIFAALVTIALKTVAYLVTGSVALLSDAAESLVNLFGAAAALVVLTLAARPADENHPFGHGKAEYFSSGFEGALIVVAAAGIAWAAWDRLMHPQALAAINLGMLVSVAAALVNLAVARVLLRAGRRSGSITLEADGKHLMTDVWTTGAVLAGLGGIALTGWQWLDPAIALLAALNIVVSGTQLILRSLSGLLGAAIPPEERHRIERILDNYRRQGIQFHDLRARVAGTQRLITLHVLVPGAMTVQEGHELLERIESDIREVIPNLLIVTHIEPLEDASSFRHEIIQ
jgi:Ca2+-transporting ATPase